MLTDSLLCSQMERITSWKLPEPLAPQPDVLGMALLLLATLAALMSVKVCEVFSSCSYSYRPWNAQFNMIYFPCISPAVIVTIPSID